MQQDPPANCSAGPDPKYKNDMHHWVATIVGPVTSVCPVFARVCIVLASAFVVILLRLTVLRVQAKTPYEGGVFQLQIEFPQDYP